MGKKKWWVIGLVALCTTIVATVLAVTVYRLYVPQRVTVASNRSVIKVYINNQEWTNGTTLNWGEIEPGRGASRGVTIINTYDKSVIVSIEIANLPTGWSLTFDKDGVQIDPNYEIHGTLTLNIPSNATPGDYEFDLWFVATVVE